MKRSRGSRWNRWKLFSCVWRACLWRTLGWAPASYCAFAAGVCADVRRKTRIRSAIYAGDFTRPVSSFTPRLITRTLIQNAIHSASCFWNTWCSDRSERSSVLGPELKPSHFFSLFVFIFYLTNNGGQSLNVTAELFPQELIGCLTSRPPSRTDGWKLFLLTL